MVDGLRYYDLEAYLFKEVHDRFHAECSLNAFDFFSIVIWKANRAKSRIAKLLLSKCPQKGAGLDEIVHNLTRSLIQAQTHRERLRILFEEWGFGLPMASAVLTVLWPDFFTVYDYRVCEELGRYHQLPNWSRFDRIWEGYEQYRDAVLAAGPDALSLRDKDRYLWGMSSALQLEKDVSTCFNMLPESDSGEKRNPTRDSPHEIPNERLKQEHLPRPDDDQLVWVQFALTFDGYAEKGTQEACAAFANAAREHWKQSGTLPVGLSNLRTALFFEQRRWRWSNEVRLNESEWHYWRSLVEAIRSELPQEDNRQPEPHEIKDLIAVPSKAVEVRSTAEDATSEPSAGEQSLDLYSETDPHGGTRSVWLRLTSEGSLILEGQDLGGAVDKFWGTSEYEWAWSLHPEQLGPFLESIGVDASDPADLLKSVGAALKALDRSEIERMFKAAGATFWNRAGD